MCTGIYFSGYGISENVHTLVNQPLYVSTREAARSLCWMPIEFMLLGYLFNLWNIYNLGGTYELNAICDSIYVDLNPDPTYYLCLLSVELKLA